MRLSKFSLTLALVLAAAPLAPAATLPATSPAKTPDLSTPRAAIVSLYTALRAGDIPAAKNCLVFADKNQAETFDLSVTPLFAPLQLMHAMEAKFGPSARKPFAAAALEKSVDRALADLDRAEITVAGDRAVIAEKKAAVDPNVETEVTGITLQRDPAENRWHVVAATFPDITAEIPPAEIPMMRAIRNAVANACRSTLDRLAKNDFKSAEQAYAAYQSQLQSAARLPPATGQTH